MHITLMHIKKALRKCWGFLNVKCRCLASRYLCADDYKERSVREVLYNAPNYRCKFTSYQ